jgi:hypothetical protein
MPNRALIVAVDRVEGRIVVLESDEGRRFDVPLRELKEKPVEGLVYSVPKDESGAPIWREAVADRAETDRRRNALQQRVDALRKRDKGGDVEL